MSPISNAKDTLLSANPGTLPNVSGAMRGWFQPLTFTSIVKSVVNHQLVEVETEVAGFGVRVPFSPQQFKLVPEGQRAWKWEAVYTLPSLILNPDDKMVFGGTTYRVMSKQDFKEYGYVLYSIAQDYTP